MLAPTGDRITTQLAELEVAIHELMPKVVIPMHYQIRQVKFPRGIWFYPMEAFENNHSPEPWFGMAPQSSCFHWTRCLRRPGSTCWKRLALRAEMQPCVRKR